MVFKNIWVLVLWVKVASALEGLRFAHIYISDQWYSPDVNDVNHLAVYCVWVGVWQGYLAIYSSISNLIDLHHFSAYMD